MLQTVARAVLHGVLDCLPDGTPVPILSGPLRGQRWHWVRTHYSPQGDLVGHGGVADYAYIAGTYESHAQQLFLEHVRPNTWVWDLGAHHGFYSKLAHHLGAKVVAFEGDWQSIPWIYRNCPSALVYPNYVNAQTYWRWFDAPDLVKCDIEGAESETLLGLFEVYRPRVFVLSTHGPIHNAFCVGLLESHSYSIETIRPDDMILAVRNETLAAVAGD